MTTAAFRSATGRSSIGGRAAACSARDAGSSGSGGPPRRSRSLSRFSGRFPPSQPEAEDFPTPPGRFVNQARGCVFPEISLDDVVDEFFRARAESEEEEESEPSDLRSRRRSSVTSYPKRTESSGRRGRSVTRPPQCQTAPPKGLSNSVLRRRRSVSVARHRCSDSECYSSSLTDAEPGDFHSRKHGVEKTIQAVYAQEKGENPIGDDDGIGLYEVVRKESEKRKQDLLAELAMEEERGQEISKIVKELLPSPKISAVSERQSQSRRRSKDRTRLSKCLTEEAEKYFEDFLFNVEDTDISSFDEERSDASSIVRDPGLRNSVAGTDERLLKTAPLPADGDGVVLPWLEWETSVAPSSPCKSKFLLIYYASTIVREASAGFSNCYQIASNFGSRSFDGTDSSSVVSSDPSRSKFGAENHLANSYNSRTTASSFDMEEYLILKQSEDILCERLRQRRRIESVKATPIGWLGILWMVYAYAVFIGTGYGCVSDPTPTISHPSSDRDSAVPALRQIPLRPPPIRQHLVSPFALNMVAVLQMGSLATAELCDANASLLAKGELRVLQPLFQMYGQCRAFCGPIVTLKVFEDNVLVREVLEAPGDGRVLVVDGGGSMRCALVGGNLGQLAQNMGWAGIVVNGCIRDAYEINGCDIGVRALGCHPLKSNKKGLGEKHVTVNIGGTIIHDGEWLYADSDGILISTIELSL
ncbi:hypothetical protein C4D60_Mb03t22660 [Musa balbisiana]|nr:hypothetical protein C4D60_Mb03t22660 [Musa balbisiana]